VRVASLAASSIFDAIDNDIDNTIDNLSKNKIISGWRVPISKELVPTSTTAHPIPIQH